MESTSDAWIDGKIFNRRFIFCFGDCNPKKEGSLYAILKLFSEMAGEHYERRGLGHGLLWERGIVFLLSRVSLRIHEPPRYGETTTTSTWEKDIKGPLLYRDFEMRGPDGRLLVSASSAWLIADPISREILRPSVLGDMVLCNEREADCEPPRKLRRNTELAPLGERPVYYTDLDSNGHVNNAVYGRIAMDFLPEALREKRVRDFHITYNMEAKLGETLSLSGGDTKGFYELQGSGDELHFATAFIFED